MFAGESVKRQEPVGRCRTIEQEGLRYGVGPRGVSLIENLELGFSDESARRHSRIRCCGQAQTAVTNGEPEIMEGNRNVEQPRRPKLPMRPASRGDGDLAQDRHREKSSDYERRTEKQEHRKNKGGDFRLREREPDDGMRAEQFCEREENTDPQQCTDRSNERKATCRHRKQTSGEISRQTRARDEASSD